MASFDPSVISQIPDMAGNPAQAKAQAYKLSDLIDEGKLRKLQLAGAQQEQKRDADIRSLLSGAKLDTPEDRMKVAGEMSRIDPSKGMQFMRETSQEQLTQLETKKLQMDFVADTIGPAAEGVLETLDTKGPAMAAAQYQQHVPEVNRKLKELGINQQLPPQLDFSNPQTRNLLQQQIAGSKTARQMRQEQLAQNRDVRQEEAGARAEKSSERQERRLGLIEQQASAKKQMDAQGVLTSDAVDLAAQRLVNGEQASAVLANFGRGKQGPQNIAKVQNRFAALAKEQGLSPQDITARGLEMKGFVSEERALGTRVAAIQTAVTEADKMAPQALETSRALPRRDWQFINKGEQAWQTQRSDKRLADFVAATNTLVNIYARAINPTGVPTDDARKHAYAMLNVVQGGEAYETVVGRMRKEMRAAEEAPDEVRDKIMKEITGRTGGKQSVPAATVPSGLGQGGATGGGNVVNWADLK